MSSPSLLRAQMAQGQQDGRLGLVVLRAKIAIRRQQFRHSVARHPGRIALQTFVVIPILFIVGLFLFLGLSNGMSAVATIDDATAILTILLTLTTVAAFIGSSTTALQSLYLANDLPLLMTLPIPLRVLFAEKFIAAMSGTIPAAMFGVVALTAFGASRAEHLAYIPAALVALALILLMATTTSVTVVALVTRSIPARRARVVLLAISLTIVGLTSLLWNAIAPSEQHLGMSGADQTVVRVGSSLSQFPTAWLAQSVADASVREFGSAARGLTDTFVLTVVALVTAYQIFARTFSRSVATTRAASTSRSSHRQLRQLYALVEPLPQDIGGLIVKEWLTIFRDLKRLSAVIWPLGVVVIYGISASRSSDTANGGPLEFWQANAALALLPWGVSLGLSIFAIGSEQRTIHLLRLLPVGPGRLFAAKVLAAAIPILIFSEVTAAIIALFAGASSLELGGMVLLVAWTTFGFVTIDTAASAFAPNFEADHIQRSTMLVGRVFGMIAGAAFALASGAAAMRLILFHADPPRIIASALTWNISGLHLLGIPFVIAALTIAILVVLVSTRIAIDRLDDLIRNGP